MIQKLTDFIIRPYRPTYDPKVDLGPKSFSIDNQYSGSRIDLKITNRGHQVLECSLFRRDVEKNKKYPLIVYCHGNTGNRTRSYGAVYSMLQSNVNVVTFDFAGCGLSQGKTISLGYYEQNDIEDVLDYVLKNFSFVDPKRIGLWGRCMGAVSCLLFASHTKLPISLLILDTPFGDFPQLIRDYIQRVKIIPKWAEDYIYTQLQIKIKEQAYFDFEEIVPAKQVPKCKMPAFFIHGTEDGIIPTNQFKKVYDIYPGPKEFVELKTSHNDPRPDFVYQRISEFVQSEFYPSLVQDPEKSPKKPNPILSTEHFIMPKLVSLDSMKFNEYMRDDEDKNVLDPVEKAIESARSQQNIDFSEFLVENKGYFEHNNKKQYYQEANGNGFHLLGNMLNYNKMEIKTMQQLSARTKPEIIPIEEDEAGADVSEELVNVEKQMERGELSVKNTKRFLHSLQKSKH